MSGRARRASLTLEEADRGDQGRQVRRSPSPARRRSPFRRGSPRPASSLGGPGPRRKSASSERRERGARRRSPSYGRSSRRDNGRDADRRRSRSSDRRRSGSGGRRSRSGGRREVFRRRASRSPDLRDQVRNLRDLDRDFRAPSSRHADEKERNLRDLREPNLRGVDRDFRAPSRRADEQEADLRDPDFRKRGAASARDAQVREEPDLREQARRQQPEVRIIELRQHDGSGAGQGRRATRLARDDETFFDSASDGERRRPRRARRRSSGECREAAWEPDLRAELRDQDRGGGRGPRLKIAIISRENGRGGADVSVEAVEAAVRHAAITVGFSPPVSVKAGCASGGAVNGTAGAAPASVPASAGRSSENALYVEFPSEEAAEAFNREFAHGFPVAGSSLPVRLARSWTPSTGPGPGAAPLVAPWLCLGCGAAGAEAAAACVACTWPRLEGSPFCLEQLEAPLVLSSDEVRLESFVEQLVGGMPVSVAKDRKYVYCPRSLELVTEAFLCYRRRLAPAAAASGPRSPTASAYFFNLAGRLAPGSRLREELSPLFQSKEPLVPEAEREAELEPSESSADANGGSEKADEVEKAEKLKASAVAAVLAAAQLTAAAAQRREAEALGGKSAAVAGASEGPALERLFGASAVAEEDEPPKEETAAPAPAAGPGPHATAAAPAAPVPAKPAVCFVCLRSFPSRALLVAHELQSTLHRKNMDLQTVAVLAAK